MKSFTLPLVLGIFAVMSRAAPSPVQPQARQAPTTLAVEFYGADATTAEYEVDVFLPTDENFYNFNITNPASVSRVCVGGPGFCVVDGADGSSVTVNGGYCADVGPPQPQVSGFCSTF